MTLKEKFIQEFESKSLGIKYIVVAMEYSGGHIDIISTSSKLYEKFKNYCDIFNDDLCLKIDNGVRIVNYMIV